MVLLRNHFLFWLFCVFIQKNIQSCSANNNNCLNLKLNASQKLKIQLYAQTGHANGLDDIVCPIVQKYSSNLIFEIKVGPLTKGQAPNLTCPDDEMCTANRYLQCMYKAAGTSDQCATLGISFDNVQTANCVCKHETDNVLLQNAKDWAALGLSDNKIPTLILNGKWDPCLAVSSVDAFDKYVAKIFQ